MYSTKKNDPPPDSILNKDTCFQQYFGITQRCESDFQWRVLECKKQDCKREDGTVELLRLEIRHQLNEGPDGNIMAACMPWFVLTDTAIRKWVISTRDKIMDQL